MWSKNPIPGGPWGYALHGATFEPLCVRCSSLSIHCKTCCNIKGHGLAACSILTMNSVATLKDEPKACRDSVHKKPPQMTCQCSGEGVGDLPTLVRRSFRGMMRFVGGCVLWDDAFCGMMRFVRGFATLLYCLLVCEYSVCAIQWHLMPLRCPFSLVVSL
jgi:hypothetical protein